MFDVVTIGSATRDNFLIRRYELTDWKGAPSGRAVVLPWGEKFGVDDVRSTLGGNAANASVTFARQGFKAACAAKIGNDAPGREFLRHLQREGVDTRLVRIADGQKTAYSALLLDSGTGERTILNYHGASDAFGAGDLVLERLRSYWWYVSLAGKSCEMFVDLIAFARARGIQVALNPSGHHISQAQQEILDSLEHVSFLVLNVGEAAALTGIAFSEPDQMLSKLGELTAGIVAITDGGRGVIVSDGARRYRAGTFRERRVADRTGAGDAFGAGFVAGLMRRNERCRGGECVRENVEYAIRLASANATAAIEEVGSTESVLTREQFDSDPRWQGLEVS